MALSKGSKVTWADIQSIYSKLNTCQSKFSISQTTIPDNPGKCSPSTISDLKNFIFALSSSSYVGTSPVSPVFNLTTPTAGELLKADPFNTMTTTLDTVSGICANCSNQSDFGDFGDRSNQGSVVANYSQRSAFDAHDGHNDNRSNLSGADGYHRGGTVT